MGKQLLSHVLLQSAAPFCATFASEDSLICWSAHDGEGEHAVLETGPASRPGS